MSSSPANGYMPRIKKERRQFNGKDPDDLPDKIESKELLLPKVNIESSFQGEKQ